MLGGKIILDGNCSMEIDHITGGVILGKVGRDMEGGTIIVNGDCDLVGKHMKGGKIIVNGNVGADAGAAMEGGEIHLNGEHKRIEPLGKKGGKIFHKGKLIIYNYR